MILSCQSICKSFGEKVILQDASFHIEEREKAALIGEEISDAEVLARMGIDPGVLKKAQLARVIFGRVSEPLLDLPANELGKCSQ